MKQCAQVLEQLKQYGDAAHLYELGRFFDRAAAAAVRAKNWTKVGELLPRVHSPKLHALYAKAMEAERRYPVAAEAYRTAADTDNLVRVLLDHLNQPDEAVSVVRRTKSVEAAKLVAKHFLKQNDHTSAVQFLALSNCHAEAFALAKEHNCVEAYAEHIGDTASISQYMQVGEYFEARRKQPLMTGLFYYKAKLYEKVGRIHFADNFSRRSLTWSPAATMTRRSRRRSAACPTRATTCRRQTQPIRKSPAWSSTI